MKSRCTTNLNKKKIIEEEAIKFYIYFIVFLPFFIFPFNFIGLLLVKNDL